MFPVGDDNPTLRTPLVTIAIIISMIAIWVFVQGAGFDDYLKDLRRRYAKITMRKPKASRARSPEVYALATGFKPGPGA